MVKSCVCVLNFYIDKIAKQYMESASATLEKEEARRIKCNKRNGKKKERKTTMTRSS